ncbi:MAG: InlB B-repeat-containing protein, partial [Methanimicrococcus sp.]|nr:InlB B-repeat-containing protein [Methanimicrococcus sp.]
DEDGNGRPDVLDTYWDVIYNDNGGNGDGPATENVAVQNGYVLNTTTLPTHVPDSGIDVVFVGWSTTNVATILSKTDTLPVTITPIVDIVNTDVTVYAVWGYDENSDNVADILEGKYTLTYNLNGGTGGPSPNSVVHVNGTYALSTTAPTRTGGIVFIGWTATQDNTIYRMNDTTAPITIPNVNINGANVIVHAVWGYDENGNGVADILDPKYSLNYDLNGGNAGTGPIPNPVTTLVDNKIYTLSTTAPTHAQVGGIDVVFIGWTASQDLTTYLRNDTAPITITQIYISANADVYAVWGFDENSNGIADVLEQPVRPPGTGFGNATIVPFGGGAMPDPQPDPQPEPQPDDIRVNDSNASNNSKIDDTPQKASWVTSLILISLIVLDIILFMYRRKYGDRVFNEK